MATDPAATAAAVAAGGKKRPRVDLLASLDAAFAAKKSAPASKYTSQAAVQAAAASSQQAYLHTKRKKKGGGTKPPQQQGAGTIAGNSKNNGGDMRAGSSNNNSNSRVGGGRQQPSDPLYGKLSVDILSVGLKNCSLLPQAKTLGKPYVLSATLRSYLDSVMAQASHGTSAAAADKLKNKVLQLDNPVKAVDASKHAHSAARAQTAKLLSARQRRTLGLHLLKGEMPFSDAEQLCAIWRRYARDVLGTDSDIAADPLARNVRLQNKLKTLDLSGCPVEVVQSRNPCTVGVTGVVVAERQHVLQLCTPAHKIITLPKREVRLRVALDDQHAVLIAGEWLLQRTK